jgi:hypothetical protein
MKRIIPMKRNLELRAILLSLALILAFSGAAFSQEEITAAISGQVTDSTGALVQNASVTVVNDDTKAERKTTTSEDGSYTITNLTPGTYTLTIEVANFKRYVQTALILNARDRRAISFLTPRLSSSHSTIETSFDYSKREFPASAPISRTRLDSV